MVKPLITESSASEIRLQACHLMETRLLVTHTYSLIWKTLKLDNSTEAPMYKHRKQNEQMNSKVF